MPQRPTPHPERPQTEPEIYPPGAAIPSERIWRSTGTHGTQRIYVAKVGPIGLLLLALLVGVGSVAATFVLLGAAVIAIAAGVVLAIGAILFTVVRERFRRFR